MLAVRALTLLSWLVISQLATVSCVNVQICAQTKQDLFRYVFLQQVVKKVVQAHAGHLEPVHVDLLTKGLTQVPGFAERVSVLYGSYQILPELPMTIDNIWRTCGVLNLSASVRRCFDLRRVHQILGYQYDLDIQLGVLVDRDLFNLFIRSSLFRDQASNPEFWKVLNWLIGWLDKDRYEALLSLMTYAQGSVIIAPFFSSTWNFRTALLFQLDKELTAEALELFTPSLPPLDIATLNQNFVLVNGRAWSGLQQAAAQASEAPASEAPASGKTDVETDDEDNVADAKAVESRKRRRASTSTQQSSSTLSTSTQQLQQQENAVIPFWEIYNRMTIAQCQAFVSEFQVQLLLRALVKHIENVKEMVLQLRQPGQIYLFLKYYCINAEKIQPVVNFNSPVLATALQLLNQALPLNSAVDLEKIREFGQMLGIRPVADFLDGIVFDATFLIDDVENNDIPTAPVPSFDFDTSDLASLSDASIDTISLSGLI